MIARALPVNVAATVVQWVMIGAFLLLLVALFLAPFWKRLARLFEPDWRGDE